MNQTNFESYFDESNVSCRVYCDYNSKMHDYASNWHKEPEFLLVVSGCEIVYIDNESYTALPGDIVAINCGKIHTITGDDFVHHCIVPSRQILRSMGINPESISFPPHIRDKELTQAFLRIIAECKEEDKKYVRQFRILAIQQFLLDILEKHNISPDSDDSSKKDPGFTITVKVIEYLRLHFAENINLNDIAKEVDTTVYHMCRCVKKATGRSIVEHLNRLRCNTAKHYLIYSDKKISEIATLCGYQSVSYFSKVYHKTIGVAPKDTPRNITMPNLRGIIV